MAAAQNEDGGVSRPTPTLPQRVYTCLVYLKEKVVDPETGKRVAATFAELRENVGIDLSTDEALMERLRDHPMIAVNELHGGNAWYEPSLNVNDRASLAQVLREQSRGVLLSELKDQAYDGVEKDVAALVRTGEVMAVNDREIAKTLLIPRFKEAFKNKMFLRVRLPGTVSVSRGSRFLRTTADLRDVVRRGELIFLGDEIKEGCVFRISTASALHLNQAWRPKLSAGFVGKKGVPNTATIPSRVFPFTASVLPLDSVYKGPSASGLNLYRQGFTSLSRRVWDDLPETDGETNPCVSSDRDKDGTILSAVKRCADLGLLVLPAEGGQAGRDVKEAVLKVALSATGASQASRNMRAKRKRISLGSKVKRRRLKVEQAHLKGNSDYSRLMGTVQGGKK